MDVINIETSAYCNRKCNYCPVSKIDRKQAYISDELFSKLLSELCEIGYRNHIALNLYNEPLLDEKLIEHIEMIREKLPECYVQFNSNGDYLTKELLDKLKKAGLNQMLVTLHVSPNQEYEDYDRLGALKNFLKKLGMEKDYGAVKIEKGRNISLDIIENGFRFLIVCNNWTKYGNDRGGTVGELSKNGRQTPCVNPFREVNISYDGFFKPCCNVYFGENTSFGDINRQGVVECYFCGNMIEFRRNMFCFGEKKGWCYSCNTEDNASKDTMAKRRKILEE